MSLYRLRERFSQAIDDLYSQGHYLAAEATKLGAPRYTRPGEPVDSAGLLWHEHSKKFEFVFDEAFEQALTRKEFCFVVAHETFHIINSHIIMMRDHLCKMRKDKIPNDKVNRFLYKFNVAADCVVNDSLVNTYGFDKELDGKIIYGKATVGRDCHDLSVNDVVMMLDQLPDKIPNNHAWQSFFDANGNLRKEVAEALSDFLRKHARNSALNGRELNDVESGLKTANSTDDPNVRGANSLGKDRDIARSGISITWQKLQMPLNKYHALEDKWGRVERKLSNFFPDTMLPFQEDKEREDIFVAIDSSGSISYEALSVFVNIMRNLPNHIKIRAISFDGACYDYNIRSNERPKGGGGTNFAIIEEYIQDNCKKYPKCVLVLTDGDGSPVFPKHPERWRWILYGYSTERFCYTMKRFKLQDLLK